MVAPVLTKFRLSWLPALALAGCGDAGAGTTTGVTTATSASTTAAGSGGTSGGEGTTAAAPTTGGEVSAAEGTATATTEAASSGSGPDASSGGAGSTSDATTGSTGGTSPGTTGGPVCGDGVVEGGETCDDGSGVGCDSYHDGGDGTCVPAGMCSPGHVLGMDGCVVELWSDHVHIMVDNTCEMTVSPPEFTVQPGQKLRLDYHNHSQDYPVDVWMHYNGGFTDLPPGATWMEKYEHCFGPAPSEGWATISTACSQYKLPIHCL